MPAVFPESISFKSNIWNHIKFESTNLKVVDDINHRHAYFMMSSHENCLPIKHSSVAKVYLKEELEPEDILNDYPKMLPNAHDLELAYSTDCSVGPAPDYWV